MLDNNNYVNSTLGTWKNYKIPIGQYLTGNIQYLTFINAQDINSPTAESYFHNIRLSEKLTPVRDNFTIVEDTPITIAASQLLSNDVGTSLKVTSVENPINGIVVLNNENIVSVLLLIFMVAHPLNILLQTETAKHHLQQLMSKLIRSMMHPLSSLTALQRIKMFCFQFP